MDYALIFYLAHKTGYCETALKNKLDNDSFIPAFVRAALTARQLGEGINEALNKLNLLFIIGDISAKGDVSLLSLLSRGLENAFPEPTAEKLKSGRSEGYFITIGKKNIIVLPDSPDHIEKLVDSRLADHLKKVVTA